MSGCRCSPFHAAVDQTRRIRQKKLVFAAVLGTIERGLPVGFSRGTLMPRLQQVLDEQRLSHADLLSDQHRVRVGRLLNANVIVVGTLSEFATTHWPGGFSGWVFFASRGVDAETGEVLFGIMASDDRTYTDGHGVAALLMHDVKTRLERKLAE